MLIKKNELKEWYERHPESGANIVKGITEAWHMHETEGKFQRLLTVRIQEKIAKWLKRPLTDLRFYEKPRRTFFFRIRQFIVHCPYCDRFKYVTVNIEGQETDREICCGTCCNIYRAVITQEGKVFRQKIM